MSWVLEDRGDAGQMLRGADDEGESRRRNYPALDLAAHERRKGVIRALAVTGVFLIAAGMGLPSGAPAQPAAQGQAMGILFLLGAARTGAPASAKTPGQKPGAYCAVLTAVLRAIRSPWRPIVRLLSRVEWSSI